MSLDLKIIVRAVTNGVKAGIDSAASAVRKLGRESANANKEGRNAFRGTISTVDRLRDSVRKTTDRVKSLNARMKEAAASGGMLGRAIRILSLAAALKWFKDASVETQQLSRGFTAVTGSAEQSAKELDYLRVTASRLGVPLKEAGNAYLSLIAAAKGTALEGQASRDIFEAVALAMGKLGKSSADTEGALLAIQQMISKGKVSAEELRGQLGERLPGAFQAAARAMGVTTAELDKMLADGDLVAEDLLPRLADELNRLYDDGKRVEGFEASWSRLKNSISGAFSAIGESSAVMMHLGNVMGWLGSLIAVVSVGYVSLAEYVRATAISVAEFWDAIKNPGEAHTIDAALKRSAEAFAEARKEIGKAAKTAFDADQNLSMLEQTAKKTGLAIRNSFQGTGDAIEKELGKSLKEAEKDLKSLDRSMDAMEKKREYFKNLTKEMQGVGDSAKNIRLIDVVNQMSTIRQSLKAEDFDGAISGAEKAADMLRKLKENGTQGTATLTTLSKKLEALVEQATGAKEEQSLIQAEQSMAEVEKLRAELDRMKDQKIDVTLSVDKSALDKLQADIKPIVIPVQLKKAEGYEDLVKLVSESATKAGN